MGEKANFKIKKIYGKLFIKKRGFMMSLINELYISHSQFKAEKAIKDSPLSIEKDNWMAIYESIEKILDGKPSSNMDLDIHLMMNRLI
jgi:hypothetical protein